MSKSFRKDLTGKRFGRLTVLEFVPSEDYVSRWKCECDCGNYIITTTGKLQSGHTKSCGCLSVDALKTRSATHNKCYTRLYTIWSSMKQRCYYQQHNRYHNYGGRGITVCDEWKDDFQAFYDWAMSNGYRDDLSIDRIDNEGNYEPSNCRWVKAISQSRNRNSNIMVEYNGKEMCLKEAAELSGVKYVTLRYRYIHGLTGKDLFKK